MPNKGIRKNHVAQFFSGRRLLFVCFTASVALHFTLSAALADSYISGTSPSERPSGAPHVTTVTRDDSFFDSALHGVQKPYPSSLMFLKDQGNWFTPFTHPGMEGRYDLRSWHTDEGEAHTHSRTEALAKNDK